MLFRLIARESLPVQNRLVHIKSSSASSASSPSHVSRHIPVRRACVYCVLCAEQNEPVRGMRAGAGVVQFGLGSIRVGGEVP